MKATLTAVIAAIEAAAIVLAGLVIVAVPAVLMYWLTFELAWAPEQVITSIAGFWLLAHLVSLRVGIDAETAMSFGLPPESFEIAISLAPLGLTAVTVLFAVRFGMRFADRGGIGSTAILGGAVGFGGTTWVVALFGASMTDWSLWLVILVPTLVFTVCTGVAFVGRAAFTQHEWWQTSVTWVQQRLEPMSRLGAAALPVRSAETLRIAVSSILGLFVLAMVGFTVAVIAGYVEVVTLSQGLQLDPLGAVIVFLLCVALLPIAFVWSVSWFTGAGFAIGQATSVTPFETLLGPLPAFPLLGVVPQGWGAIGALAPALIVIVGIVIGSLAGGRSELRNSSVVVVVLLPLIAAACAGLFVAACAALASGAIGPGRLEHTGPDPWLTGGLAAVELGVGLLIGLLVRRFELARYVMRRSDDLGKRAGRADDASQFGHSTHERE